MKFKSDTAKWLLKLKMAADNLWAELEIDFSSRWLVIKDKRGEVYKTSLVLVWDRLTHELVAYGEAAEKMEGKIPDQLEMVWPVAGGVISNIEALVAILMAWWQIKIKNVPWYQSIFSPKVTVLIPNQMTDVQKRAYINVISRAFGSIPTLKLKIVEAARAAGLGVDKALGRAIMIVGASRVEAAVVSMSGVVRGVVENTGLYKMENALDLRLKEQYGLIAGRGLISETILNSGSLIMPLKKTKNKTTFITMRGRHATTGLPHSVRVNISDIRDLMMPVALGWVEVIKKVLLDTPPELVADVHHTGLMVIGPGSKVNGLVELLTGELRVPVMREEE